MIGSHGAAKVQSWSTQNRGNVSRAARQSQGHDALQALVTCWSICSAEPQDLVPSSLHLLPAIGEPGHKHQPWPSTCTGRDRNCVVSSKMNLLDKLLPK